MIIFLACSDERIYTTMDDFRNELLSKEGVLISHRHRSSFSNGQIPEDAARGGIKPCNVVLAIIQEGDMDVEQIERSIVYAGDFRKPVQIIIQNTALTPELQTAYPDAIIFDEQHPEKIQEIIRERAEEVYQSPDVNFKKEVIWKLYELAAKYFVETYEPATQTATV